MAMDGIPLSEIARFLGDSEKTVEKIYAKHAPDYLRNASAALARQPNVRKKTAGQRKAPTPLARHL
jgi:hypothetical protein